MPDVVLSNTENMIQDIKVQKKKKVEGAVTAKLKQLLQPHSLLQLQAARTLQNGGQIRAAIPTRPHWSNSWACNTSHPHLHSSAPAQSVLRPAGKPAFRPSLKQATETSEINYGSSASPLPSLDLLNDLQKQASNACRLGGLFMFQRPLEGAFRVAELSGDTSPAHQEHPSEGNSLRALPANAGPHGRSPKCNILMRRRKKFIRRGLEIVTTVGWSMTQ